MSNSSDALANTDRAAVYDVILDAFRRVEAAQDRQGDPIGMAHFMVEWWVRRKLGDEPAKNTKARLTELASMVPPVLRIEGSRKNPKSGQMCRNYRLTGASVGEYVPRNTRYRDLLREAVAELKAHQLSPQLISRCEGALTY